MSQLIPQWKDIIAVFGGTFDPPHLGHREAARALLENPGVKRVWILPAGLPPHKSGATQAHHRLAMTRLNFSTHANSPYPREIEVRSLELDRAERTGARTYSFETLQELRRETDQLAFVIGADQLRDLPSWHRYPELLGLCHWIVLGRKPDGAKKAYEAAQALEQTGLITRKDDNLWKISGSSAAFLTVVPTPAPAISGTQIRETIAKTGQPPEDLLLPDVMAYLKHHSLYGTQRFNYDH